MTEYARPDSGPAESAGLRRRAVQQAKAQLRELRIELAALSHQVGARVDLKDSDLDALDVIGRHGPIGPSALARRLGVHGATLTGILDRLEAGGWIARQRSSQDRRSVVVEALPDRSHEIYRIYGGMSAALDEILAGYSTQELAIITGFLKSATTAGRASTDRLNDAPK